MIIADKDDMRLHASNWIVNNEKSILELGCSDGNFAELLNKKGIVNYKGVDILKDRISEAKAKFPGMNFICCDILKNLDILKDVGIFVSFQCLEHIKEDLKIITAIPHGTHIIISVPNKPFRKAHVRWFELDGWTERFSPYIDFEERITYQHPRKENNRYFLFKGNKK